MDTDAITSQLATLPARRGRRRLIPIVAALLGGLVVIPVALSHGAPSAPAALRPASASPPAGAPAATAPAIPTVGHSTAARVRLNARAHGPAVPVPAAAAPSAVPSGAPPAVTAPPDTVTRTVTQTLTKTVTVTAPAPSAARLVVPQVQYMRYLPSLSFGPAGGTVRSIAGTARFLPLPSAAHVAAVLLGVLGDGRSAAFLVSNRATESGSGTCRPSPAHCVYLTLTAGGRERLVLHNWDGTVSHYVLRVLGVSRAVSTTPLRTPVDASGALLVAEVARRLPSLRSLRVSWRTGLIALGTSAPRRAQRGAHPG